MRCPNKPDTKTAWDWYDWALQTAVATRAKRGHAIACKEEHSLPHACRQAITAGWLAGLHAVETIERIEQMD